MPGENVQDWSVTAANNASADSSINWAEGMARAAVNDSARSMMAAIAKERNLENGSITTGGTGSAFTFSSGRSHTGSVPTNMMVLLKMSAAPSSGATLNMDGIGAITIKNQNASSLAGGEWPANSYQSFVYDGTNWVFLNDTTVAGVSASAAGAVLTASNGCSLVLISSSAAASSATIDFTSGITSTYDKYIVIGTSIVPASSGTDIWLRVSEDNGSSFKAGATDYFWAVGTATDVATTGNAGAQNDTKIKLNIAITSSASFATSFELHIPGPSGSSSKKQVWYDSAQFNGSNFVRLYGAGLYNGTVNPVNGLRFMMSSGNLASGNFALYGVKKS